ncbi:hypothetical protein BJX64DRAFT_294058 [Aspergillus heterothallicus]
MALAQLPSWMPPPDLTGITRRKPATQYHTPIPRLRASPKHRPRRPNLLPPHSHAVQRPPANNDLLFSHADPFDLIAPETTTQEMVERALSPPDPAFDPVTVPNADLVYNLSDWETIDWTDPRQAPWITPSQLATLTSSPYPMRVFWKHLFHKRHPDLVTALLGGTFAVRREAIWRHPREFYQRCLDEFCVCGAECNESGGWTFYGKIVTGSLE